MDSERAAFISEALPHLGRIYSTAAYLCGDADRASDLVQETYLRAFRFFHKFEQGTNCRAWLLTILHNTFLNQRRAERHTRSNVDIDDPIATSAVGAASSNPETLVLSEIFDQEIVKALQELPEDFRSAVVLVDLQELTYEEAAKALSCPIGTVRSRLSRGRHLLAQKLAAYARDRGFRGKGSV
jgi:RNA polymerase sigma-70 factor (ECF subfamily)